MTTNRMLRLLFLAGCLVPLAACVEEKEPVPEGCEHLAEGPEKTVTGAVQADLSAPVIEDDHHRYAIALPAGAGGNVGSVRFQPSEAGLYSLYVGSALEVELQNATTATGAVSWTTAEGSDTGCAEAKLRLDATLEVGTYFLSFGPTPESSVSVVVEQVELGHLEGHGGH